jgi:hypothetical protein
MSTPVPYRNELATERALRRPRGGLPEHEKRGKTGETLTGAREEDGGRQ